MNVNSTAVFPQLVIAVIISLAIFILYMAAEQIYTIWNSLSAARVPVLPMTLVPGSDTKVFLQGPPPTIAVSTGNTKYLNLAPSENQLTGIEFSYTTFIYIMPDTDSGQAGWKTIFYKGYVPNGTATPGAPAAGCASGTNATGAIGAFPLLAPGVFISSDNGRNDTPTLRVVMNTYDSWFNTVDVQQVPFKKWVHLAIVLRQNSLEVYINGNLANKTNFKGTLPYQNYQPLVILPDAFLPSSETAPTPSFDNTATGDSSYVRGIPPGDTMAINGKFTGYVSNLYYFGYAITYAEIMQMMNMGPSSQIDTNSQDLPPYLIDTWWTQNKG